MKTRLITVVLFVSAFASRASAQHQGVIVPPPGGVPIVAGGWYTLGTVFANGMAYPSGTSIETLPLPGFTTANYMPYEFGLNTLERGYFYPRTLMMNSVYTYPAYGSWGNYNSYGTMGNYPMHGGWTNSIPLYTPQYYSGYRGYGYPAGGRRR